MRQILIGAGAVALAAGWTAAGQHRPAARSIDDKVRAVAAGVASITPKALGDGMTLRSSRAEGATIVLAIDGVADWRPVYTDAEMARMMGTALCAAPGIPKMLGEGATLRFELTAPGGATLPPLTLDRCD